MQLTLQLMRWRPFVPGGMPHRLTRDDEYMGYHIPKGAFFLGNTGASLVIPRLALLRPLLRRRVEPQR
jgi:cytochrome P450